MSFRSPARWSRGRPTRSPSARGCRPRTTRCSPEDYSEEVALPDLEPSVGLPEPGVFLWSQGQHAVAIEAVNVPKVRMTIDRVYLNNLFFLFQYGGFYERRVRLLRRAQHALGDRLKEDDARRRRQEEQEAAYRDRPRPVRRHQGARPLPGLGRQAGRLRGVAAVAACSPTWARWPSRGTGEFLVWVSSLGDLSPVAGRQGDADLGSEPDLASGRTDGSGIWRVRTPRRSPRARRTW